VAPQARSRSGEQRPPRCRPHDTIDHVLPSPGPPFVGPLSLRFAPRATAFGPAIPSSLVRQQRSGERSGVPRGLRHTQHALV
jgi:hypothetical protein